MHRKNQRTGSPDKIPYAVVGLGHIAQKAILPANDSRLCHPDVAPLAVGMFITAADGRMVSCNGTAASLLDFKAGVKASHSPDQFPGSAGTQHSIGAWPIDNILKTRSALHDFELPLSTAEGGSRHVLLYSDLLHDSSNNLSGTLNLILDITCRKRTEEVAARLAGILESCTETVITENLQAIITSADRHFHPIFGYPADEVMGQPMALLFGPQACREHLGMLGCLAGGRSESRLQTVGERSDATCADISLTASAIKNVDGQVIGVSNIIRDLNGCRRIERELRRLYGELAAIKCAHECFIAGLGQASDTLFQDIPFSDKHHFCISELTVTVNRHLEMIRTNLQSETALIDILLDMACIELSKQPG